MEKKENYRKIRWLDNTKNSERLQAMELENNETLLRESTEQPKP